MTYRAEILETIAAVAKEQNCDLISLDGETPLLETGLDSLCLAIIVARLEDRFGFDPFSQAEDTEFPVTVDDFIKAYTESQRQAGSLAG